MVTDIRIRVQLVRDPLDGIVRSKSPGRALEVAKASDEAAEDLNGFAVRRRASVSAFACRAESLLDRHLVPLLIRDCVSANREFKIERLPSAADDRGIQIPALARKFLRLGTAVNQFEPSPGGAVGVSRRPLLSD